MTKVPKYWKKAKNYLSKKDKVLAKLIKSYQSPSEIILTSRRNIFFSLCKSIIGQQISVAAANAVFCLLYTSPSPRDTEVSRMPSSA